MAQVTGTYSQYDAKGLREDLSDLIYSISPTETPYEWYRQRKSNSRSS